MKRSEKSTSPQRCASYVNSTKFKKSKRRNKEKTHLLNGCWRTEISVTPETWENKNASIKAPWQVWYRFFDPQFKLKYPRGKPVQVERMNSFKTLEDRQEATRKIKSDQEKLIDHFKYNPITERIMTEDEESGKSRRSRIGIY
ncbi:hypothetical protein ECE50_017515 [Chitinophaga sp. Mgbs1]|uniref:Uncharacterized protein n=1 Tax=Chitinophaga solisilvae TaxID=1233460 RepID=A0A433W8W0_9BACT|nr:hypothetical protein [Chitinophaga solisilvae]